MKRSTGSPQFVLLAMLLLVGCGPDRLISAKGDLAFPEPTLDAGHTWVGGVLEAQAILQNRGRSRLEVSWTHEGSPWEFEQLPESVEPGETSIKMRLPAAAPGTYRATLTARSGDTGPATLEILATVLEIPECPQPVACATVAFDIQRGECVEAPLPDGTECDPGSRCVLDATCRGGRCVGTPVTCDDGNACTLDTCNAVTGCEFAPAPPCPGDGKCQVGVCDPKIGCSLAPASDGTTCGDVTCDAAMVCLSGSCVQRDPPDGFICAEPTPCQGAGVCQGSACVRPPATALQPSWSYDSATDVEPKRLHDFILEPDGDLALMGFFTEPVINANRSTPVRLAAPARRCMGWNGQLVCADYRSSGGDGKVAMINTTTGLPTWIFDLKVSRPDILAASDELFLARVASLGSDRLAALYEAYPKNSGRETLCRRYYLVILDAAGGLVAAQPFTDPMLDLCNHPHPYGVASDNSGNLYLSFSPSADGSAPLAPTSPSLFLSFTRDGVLRWKRTDTQVGGELALARGRVFPENGYMPLLASTGQPQPPPPDRTGPIEQLGRIVGTSSHYVTRDLKAYAYNGQSAWEFAFPEGDFLLSRELRAITWTPPRSGASSESAVLAFAQRAGIGSLMAVRATDGRELWSCPVNAPIMNAPQLFETTVGGFAVMGGAITCGQCDPPFAYSASSFWSFEVPGFGPPVVPWPGTFGGANHDHLEDLVWIPTEPG